MQLQNGISRQFIPAIDVSSDMDDPSLAFGWWLERVLARVRWCAVPVCALTVLLFPSISPWLLLVPAAVYGFGNVPLSWLLTQQCTFSRLRSARTVATALD